MDNPVLILKPSQANGLGIIIKQEEIKILEEKIKFLKFRDVDYMVSNLGAVFKDGKELKQNTNADGYKVISIPGNRQVGVHRFVAFTFIENDEPDEKLEVNHIDFDRANNKANNLEWLSHADNVRHSRDHARYPDYTGRNNPNYGNKTLKLKYEANPDMALKNQSRPGAQNGRCQPVAILDDSDNIIHEFDYMGEAAEFLKLNHGLEAAISGIRDGIYKSIKREGTYRGFKFIKI